MRMEDKEKTIAPDNSAATEAEQSFLTNDKNSIADTFPEFNGNVPENGAFAPKSDVKTGTNEAFTACDSYTTRSAVRRLLRSPDATSRTRRCI